MGRRPAPVSFPSDPFPPPPCFPLFPSPCVSAGERQEWVEALQTAQTPPHSPPPANKLGLLELRGYKGRVLVSLAGSRVRLCKTEQV